MTPNRLRSIDGLRAMAAISVVIFHYEEIYIRSTTSMRVIPAASSQYSYLCLLGVELFFMISGFVILMSAEKAKSAPLFLCGRAARIYPAYLVSIVPSMIAMFIIYGYSPNLILRSAVNVTMLQKFIGVGDLITPYWTLAYEILFYLILAILIRLNLISKIPVLCFGWLALVILIYLLKIQGLINKGGFLENFAVNSFGSFFVMGMMTYLIFTGRASFIVIASLGLALLSTLRGRSDWAEISGGIYFITSAIFEVLLMLAAASRLKVLNYDPIVWLGQQSYSLYLLHMPVGLIFCATCNHLGLNPIFGIVISFPFSIWIASLSRRLIEVPGQYLLGSIFNRMLSKSY